MVQVTDRAKEQLEMIRDQNDLPPGQEVTLVAGQGGELGFAVSSPQENDELVERDGKTIMVIPEMLVEPLKSVVIDYVETPDMQGFTIEQQQG